MAPTGSSLSSALYPSTGLRCRVLCIGLGGGSLPLFLSHHFPGMDVEVVEIDSVVIEAARTAMGFPEDRLAVPKNRHNHLGMNFVLAACHPNGDSNLGLQIGGQWIDWLSEPPELPTSAGDQFAGFG